MERLTVRAPEQNSYPYLEDVENAEEKACSRDAPGTRWSPGIPIVFTTRPLVEREKADDKEHSKQEGKQKTEDQEAVNGA